MLWIRLPTFTKDSNLHRDCVIGYTSSIGNGGSGAVFEKLLRNGHSLYYLPQQTIRKLNHCFSTFQRIF